MYDRINWDQYSLESWEKEEKEDQMNEEPEKYEYNLMPCLFYFKLRVSKSNCKGEEML